MLIKIIGCKGNSCINWTLNFLKKEYKNYSPIDILFYYPFYYYPLKDRILEYNLDVRMKNFLTFQKSPDTNPNTIVIICSHDLNEKDLKFIKDINPKHLIFAGDPNLSDYSENWGQNHLKDFHADISHDINQFYSFPLKLYNEITKIIPKMKLNNIPPYIPKLSASDLEGEVTEVKKEFLFPFLKEVDLGEVLIASKDKNLKVELFDNNIAYRSFSEDFSDDETFKIPIHLFKYVDTLEAINQEKRMISQDEIIRVIRLTRAEIVQRFGGRKLLYETFEPIKEVYAKVLKRLSFFEYLIEQLIKDRIEYCLTPLQSSYYKRWKSNIKNKEWISPKIHIAYPTNVKFGEFDTVITEEFYPILMWRILLRAKNRIVYIK